jgi:hypothetical protein
VNGNALSGQSITGDIVTRTGNVAVVPQHTMPRYGCIGG